jgi:hypothetical protein
MQEFPSQGWQCASTNGSVDKLGSKSMYTPLLSFCSFCGLRTRASESTSVQCSTRAVRLRDFLSHFCMLSVSLQMTPQLTSWKDVKKKQARSLPHVQCDGCEMLRDK